MENWEMSTTVAIIGGGPAGYVAAIRAASLGADVVLIEEREIGGVCLNRGCIPTKALLESSDIVSKISKAKEFGVEAAISKVNWRTALDRKYRVVKSLRIGLDGLLNNDNLTILKGKGIIVNPNCILARSIDREIKVNCEKMIITTGSQPLKPNIPGIELPGVLTSDDILEMDVLPKNMVIIGAGAIGLEFATMFSSIGTKVTVVEMQDVILPKEDKEITAELLKIMKRQGVGFKLSTRVIEIRKSTECLEVYLETDGIGKVVQTECVLLAIGRKLGSCSSDIEALNINIKEGAIAVDSSMRTSVNGVYAAGDVIGGKLLAHLSYAEGRVAAENALGYNTKLDYSVVPSCVYTSPEVASVGMSEEEAKALGIDYITGRFEFRSNGRAVCLGERDGFVKVLVERGTGIIIGGHIIGIHASELISEISLAITLKAKAETVSNMIHPHPTLSEALMEACSDAVKNMIKD